VINHNAKKDIANAFLLGIIVAIYVAVRIVKINKNLNDLNKWVQSIIAIMIFDMMNMLIILLFSQPFLNAFRYRESQIIHWAGCKWYDF